MLNIVKTYKLYLFSFMVFGGLGIVACRQEFMKPPSFVKYIRNAENGFLINNEAGSLQYEAFYQPPEYFTLIQLSGENPDQVTLQEELEKNRHFFNFQFSLRPTSNTPVDEVLQKFIHQGEKFESKKQKMLYSLQNKFFLKTAGNSYECVFCLATPSGKIDNAYHFMLAFEKDSALLNKVETDNMTLLYQDSLWQMQNIEFQFDMNKINQTPKLKF